MTFFFTFDCGTWVNISPVSKGRRKLAVRWVVPGATL